MAVHLDPPPSDLSPSPSSPPKPKPPPPSYVIQFPKEQIFYVPPPENADRHRRSTPSLCCRSPLSIALLACLFIVPGILFLFLRPQLPSFSADRLSAQTLNISSTLRAVNPNGAIAVKFHAGGSISVSSFGVPFAFAAWPAFDQTPGNVTVFETVFTGIGFGETDPIWKALRADSHVPLEFKLTAPFKFRFSFLTTWTFTVRARCDIVVERLKDDENSRIVSQVCVSKLDF